MTDGESFALVSNTSTARRVLLFVVLLNVVVFPIVGGATWVAMTALGPQAAAIVGVVLALPLLVGAALLFNAKKRYRLTVTPFAVTLLDAAGSAITSLDRRAMAHELAVHVSTGRVSFRTPVVVMRAGSQAIAIGCLTLDEPAATARKVSAPKYLVEREALGPLLAALDSPVAP